MEDNFYVKFEEKFRGSRSLIKERLGVYLPCINILKDIDSDVLALDLGCGRGEWLELLVENNWHVLGIDLNKEMVNECKQRNIPAVCENIVDYLAKQDDSSVSVITGFHIAEHLSFDDLLCLVKNALRVLKPGGIIILETPNPENILVSTRDFYLDPSHKKPIPPELLKFITENAGFTKNEIIRLNGPEYIDEEKILSRQLRWYYDANPDYSIIAQKEFNDDRFNKCFESIMKKPYALDLFLKNLEQKCLEEQNMSSQIQNMSSQIQNMSSQIQNMSSQIQNIKRQQKKMYKWSLLHLYEKLLRRR